MKQSQEFLLEELSIRDQEIQYDNLRLHNCGIISKEQFEILQEEQLVCYKEELFNILGISEEDFIKYGVNGKR